MVLLLKTGLRIGEALAIHEEQIDRANGMLLIDRQYDSSQSKVVQRTKGKRVRMIYLIDEALSVLPKNQGPIFRKPDGTTISSCYFLRFILPKACQKAEVKKIRSHALRHSFAANYLMNKGSIWDLSKILVHQSVETTEKYYAHFSMDHIKDRMKILEKNGNVIRANFGEGVNKGLNKNPLFKESEEPKKSLKI